MPGEPQSRELPLTHLQKENILAFHQPLGQGRGAGPLRSSGGTLWDLEMDCLRGMLFGESLDGGEVSGLGVYVVTFTRTGNPGDSSTEFAAS